MLRDREPPKLRYRAMHVLVATDEPGRIGLIREIVAAELEETRLRSEWGLLLAFPSGAIMR